WFVDRPGQLFSLSSKEKTHYFFRSRGDKVTNEAVQIGKNKEKTNSALKEAGVLIPEGRRFAEGAQDEVLVSYAEDLGYPVVLKPTDGSFGRGVVSNIASAGELEDALVYVRRELGYKDVIIEQYIRGEDYRLYVVGDQEIAAMHRTPPYVTGGGHVTIEQLIKQRNEIRDDNARLRSSL